MRISLSPRRPYRWALGIALALLGLSFLRFLVPHRLLAPPRVTVAFLGYTNTVPGMAAGVFGLTNTSRFTVILWSGCDIEIEGARVPLPSATRFPQTILRRGEGFVTVLGLPPRPAKWRARWGVSRSSLKERLAASLKRICQWKIVRDWQVPLETLAVETEWLAP